MIVLGSEAVTSRRTACVAAVLLLASAAVAALPVAAVAQGAEPKAGRRTIETTPAPRAVVPEVMAGPSGSFAPALSRVVPAVVSVLVTGEMLSGNRMEPRGADGTRAAFPAPTRQPFRSGGSGVMIDPGNGHIVTNHHVVAGATSIEISLSDGRRFPARLVGTDPGSDLAVLEVAERGLPGVIVGDSDKVRVGDLVLAVGNPYGLEGTSTFGIVSALMRSGLGHEAVEDFIQIDAAINPGNSGGALVNTRGELIGINTAGASERSRAAGIGFAIPVGLARAIKAQLIAHGRVQRGSVGIATDDLSREQIAAAGMAITRGAVITRVLPGSSAHGAGIGVGDVVVGISGKPVRSAAEFESRVASVPIGAALAFDIWRNGRMFRLDVVAQAPTTIQTGEPAPTELRALDGAHLREIRVGNPLFGQQRGVEVTAVAADTKAHASGLEPGDVIVSVDGTAVHDTDHLVRVVQKTGMQYRMGIVRATLPAWMPMPH